MFIYYTNLSNLVTLIAAVFFAIMLISRGGKETGEKTGEQGAAGKCRAGERPAETNKVGKDTAGNSILVRAAAWLKYLAACMTTVTFLVVVCILVPMQGIEMLYSGNFLYFHLICPLLQLFSFLFFDPVHIEKKKAFPGVLPTLLYAAVTVLCNLLGVLEGPYPFLMVRSQPVWLSAVWCVVILGLSYLIAYLLLACKTGRKTFS